MLCRSAACWCKCKLGGALWCGLQPQSRLQPQSHPQPWPHLQPWPRSQFGLSATALFILLTPLIHLTSQSTFIVRIITTIPS